MEEMRLMLNERRNTGPDWASRRTPSMLKPVSTTSVAPGFDLDRLEQWTTNIEAVAEDADKRLVQVIDKHSVLCDEIALMGSNTNAAVRTMTLMKSTASDSLFRLSTRPPRNSRGFKTNFKGAKDKLKHSNSY